MQKVIVISGCQKAKIVKNNYCVYDFHFIGYLCGEKVNKIKITSNKSEPIVKGEEYLLFLEVISLSYGILWTRLIKLKDLKNICYLNK